MFRGSKASESFLSGGNLLLIRLLRSRHFYTAGAILVTAVVTILSLLPNPPVPPHSFNGLDKIEHMAAWAAVGFFLLPVLRRKGDTGKRSFLTVLGLTLLYGGGIEIVQGFIGRSRELFDLAADLAGAAAGAGLFLKLERRFFPPTQDES